MLKNWNDTFFFKNPLFSAQVEIFWVFLGWNVLRGVLIWKNFGIFSLGVLIKNINVLPNKLAIHFFSTTRYWIFVSLDDEFQVKATMISDFSCHQSVPMNQISLDSLPWTWIVEKARHSLPGLRPPSAYQPRSRFSEISFDRSSSSVSSKR